MITSLQFDAALKTITDYKVQLERELHVESSVKPYKIDIQKSIKISLFNVLRNYYFDEHKIDLRWDDLRTMDLKLLQEINFNKLKRYRGFGKMASFKFQEILVSYLIIDPY
jgi:hypothetical protein